jgi:serine/threonine transporter
MKILNGLKKAVGAYTRSSLILRILCGIVLGVVLAFLLPNATGIGLLGDLFVGALKAIAPLLVFLLVISALSQGGSKLDKRFGMVIFFYLLTTLIAAFVAVIASFMFPVDLVLTVEAAEQAAPSGIGEVLSNLLKNMIANPLASIIDGKYLGILFWAVVFGMALKGIASDSTKTMFSNMADGVSQAVRWIINLAPFGIMGLVYSSVSSYGVEIFTTYGKLIALLVGCMLFSSLIVNPIIVAISLKCNPFRWCSAA